MSESESLFAMVKQRNLIYLYQKVAGKISDAWRNILLQEKGSEVAANIENQAKLMVKLLEIIKGDDWNNVDAQKNILRKLTEEYNHLKVVIKNNTLNLQKIKEALAVLATMLLQRGKTEYLFYDKLAPLKTEEMANLKQYYNIVEGIVA